MASTGEGCSRQGLTWFAGRHSTGHDRKVRSASHGNDNEPLGAPRRRRATPAARLAAGRLQQGRFLESPPKGGGQNAPASHKPEREARCPGARRRRTSGEVRRRRATPAARLAAGRLQQGRFGRPQTERGGFEPPVRLPVHTLSKRAHSTALTPLQCSAKRRAGESGTGAVAGVTCSTAHLFHSSDGEVGIRTLGTVAGTPVFETGPFDHSGTSPELPRRGFYWRSAWKKALSFAPHSSARTPEKTAERWFSRES
jgi:hypothetical protein